VLWVVLLLIEMPLNSAPNVLVLMAVPNLRRIAFDLKYGVLIKKLELLLFLKIKVHDMCTNDESVKI
jgi:hypothetical protein